MDTQLTFTLPVELKQKINTLTHELSLKEGRTITNGELVRRALTMVYDSDPIAKKTFKKKGGKK